jgi:hypothetical protein
MESYSKRHRKTKYFEKMDDRGLEARLNEQIRIQRLIFWVLIGNVVLAFGIFLRIVTT